MHKCKSIVFKCMDFRLTKETIRFLEENNLMETQILFLLQVQANLSLMEKTK
jgi:hypothetical protein